MEVVESRMVGGMDAAIPNRQPPSYGDWDKVRVTEVFFDHLYGHPVFEDDPKAINTAQYWLNALDKAICANDGQPVTWGWKDIQDRFRAYSGSHTASEFRDALRDLKLIKFSSYRPPANDSATGECRQFEITNFCRRLLTDCNSQWLYKLLDKKDAEYRRNQIRISRRKKTKTVYSEAIKTIIDDVLHGVEFDSDATKKLLARDRAESIERYSLALHLLVAFQTEKFCELEMKEGRIYHEFVALPRKYRPFASFKGKPYIATIDIRACHPTFLGKLLNDYYEQYLVMPAGENVDNRDKAAIAKLTQIDRAEFDKNCKTWTHIFTNKEDPRDWIVRKNHFDISRENMKQCLNRWLNGGRQYTDSLNGQINRKNNRKLEQWFRERFPEMAKVWETMRHREATGSLITEAYECELMLNPELYKYADEKEVTLIYEYDGVGVFAEPNDEALERKLHEVGSFIVRESVERFSVPVVVKQELLSIQSSG